MTFYVYTTNLMEWSSSTFWVSWLLLSYGVVTFCCSRKADSQYRPLRRPRHSLSTGWTLRGYLWCRQTDGQKDRRTEGWLTDGRTDRQTDGRTDAMNSIRLSYAVDKKRDFWPFAIDLLPWPLTSTFDLDPDLWPWPKTKIIWWHNMFFYCLTLTFDLRPWPTIPV